MTEKKLEPNKEEMLAFVEHLFLDCMQSGLIELAWTPPKETNVRLGLLFKLDELPDLVEEAARLNVNEGVNVFVGPGVRHPDTVKGRRADDKDIIYLPALYADLDDAGVAEAAAALYHHLKPTMIVTTGKVPHLRQQLWWKLDEPAKDLFQSSAQIKGITEILRGDASVHNPSRVMRLPGSIAWPKKDGRVEEMTSLENGGSYQFCIDDFKNIFPPRPDLIKSPENIPAQQPITDQPASGTTLNLPSPSGIRVKDCLAGIRKPHGWHDNVLRLTGRWVQFGLETDEILLLSAGLTLAGYSVDHTAKELSTMIEGARKKWGIPNPEHVITDAPVLPLTADFLDELNVSVIPRREWILGTMLLKKHLSVLIAAPGVGKSTLCIAQAIAIITGKEITGQPVHRPGKVWIYNNEDETDELKRRLAAALQHHQIDFSEIKGKLALNSGADRQLLVAKMMPDGSIIQTPDVDACVEHIKKNDISVFIADPFVETHELEENSNQQIKVVSQMFREIARRGKCAVLLVHHTSKPQKGSSEGYAGDMNTARGASSLGGVARVMNTFHSMSKKDGERYGIPENERHLYVRLDDAKANLSLISPDAQWFKRVSVEIQNGEEVGMLERVALEDTLTPAIAADQADQHHTIIAALLAQIKEPETTLNKAAVQLAWGGHADFAKYRVEDKDRRQKASTTLRNLIIAACKAQIVIVTGTEACGFTYVPGKTAMLKRFSRPAAPAEVASQEPEIFNNMEDENEF